MHATITAHLDTPAIGDLGPLDGPLAWAAWQLATQAGVEVPPITDDYAHDFDLPLETWTRGDHWGWCVSMPLATADHYSSVQIRKKPPSQAMALYTSAREHHVGLGPTKARNVTLSATHYSTVTWHADVSDETALHEHLQAITHLGGRHRNGFGHITRWEVTEGPVDGWENRPLPHPDGKKMRVRAPYWHPTERTLCR